MIRNNNEKIKFLKYIKHMTIDIDSKSINTRGEFSKYISFKLLEKYLTTIELIKIKNKI